MCVVRGGRDGVPVGLKAFRTWPGVDGRAILVDSARDRCGKAGAGLRVVGLAWRVERNPRLF